MLEGVNVALGITGSIAAVKTVELAHELRRRGASVRGVMSESATGIVHPWAVEFATDRPVVTELTGAVEHVELCAADGWADVLVIAPATANTIGKIAGAVDDTPVTTCATTAIGAGTPVVIAPAMHEPMYDHPGVLDAIGRVEEWGISIVEPRIEEEKAKIATEDAIALTTARAATPSPLAGRHVAVTSGATSEPIDPIRVLTNRASGRTGRAVARACFVNGADVTLLHDGADVPYAAVERVETTGEMIDAAREVAADADVLVSAAAIGDFTADPQAEKIRSGEELSLSLEPTPKLLDTVRAEHSELPIVGFKAETGVDDETLVESARTILHRADLEFVVANDADVMGDEETQVLFVDTDDADPFSGSKPALGFAVADRIAAIL